MIPTMILSALHDIDLPVYGDGKNVRDWLYVDDNCAAIDCVARKGKVGEIYNIASQEHFENNAVVSRILKELDKPESLITYVKDRAGHDRRYAIRTDKISRLGRRPAVRFEEGLRRTIVWYQERV
jgi:dTDP-glucose 4,6-dehydratase